MKKVYALVACIAAFTCGCGQKSDDDQMKKDQTPAQQPAQKPCGSCAVEKSEKVEKVVKVEAPKVEAPKVEAAKVEAPKESVTVSAPAVKVEKAQ